MHVSDRHNNAQLDHIDAKVALVFCVSGMCHCVVMDPACAGDQIVTNVTPRNGEAFGGQVAIAFGKALLWMAFLKHKICMLAAMLERMTTACENCSTLPDGANPVARRAVHMSGDKSTVHMEHLEEDNEHNGIPAVNNNNNDRDENPRPRQQQRHNIDNASGQGNQQPLPTMVTNQGALQQAVNEHTARIKNVHVALSHQEKTPQTVMRKVDANPLRMPQQADNRRGAVA